MPNHVNVSLPGRGAATRGMMIKAAIVAALPIVAAPVTSSADAAVPMALAESGRTRYVIVIGKDAGYGEDTQKAGQPEPLSPGDPRPHPGSLLPSTSKLPPGRKVQKCALPFCVSKGRILFQPMNVCQPTVSEELFLLAVKSEEPPRNY